MSKLKPCSLLIEESKNFKHESFHREKHRQDNQITSNSLNPSTSDLILLKFSAIKFLINTSYQKFNKKFNASFKISKLYFKTF